MFLFYIFLTGKIHKVLKQVEIKQEPLGGSATVYATTVGGNMGTFTQMVSASALRIQKLDK